MPSSHGEQEGGLALEDGTGKTRLVSAQVLAGLFELFSDHLECVLLNGCYSQIQADAITQYVPYVIGMSQSIGDSASISFSVGFYDALASGLSIENAFKFGRNAIQLEGIPEDLTPVLIRKSEGKLQRYDQALEQYQKEFSRVVQQKYPINLENRLQLENFRSVLGLSDEDSRAIETQIEDCEEIRLAARNQSIQSCQRLAQAIMRRIGAADCTPLQSTQFPYNALWEITLPATGLQLATQKAILYLSQEANSIPNDSLKRITQQRNRTFLIFASVTNTRPEGLSPLQVIWFSPSSLLEMIEIPENEKLGWLARFIFGQINVVTLPGILPYKTKGVAKLFFGRESELARITSGSQKGGILVGAHRSGKTSFMEKLKEKLQRQKCKVVGPLTFFELQSFFKDTLAPLGINLVVEPSLEDWSSALKSYRKKRMKTA